METEKVTDKFIKSAKTAKTTSLQGITLTTEDAEKISRVKRDNSALFNVHKNYVIDYVDSSYSDRFVLKLRNNNDSEDVFRATIFMEDNNKADRDLIKEAQWGHSILKFHIDGKELRGKILEAKILGVTEPDN